ncbi:SDR family NAD(P)-dependent oxidoreductase, partial [Vibrio anguillarum]
MLEKNTQALAKEYPKQFECHWLDLADQVKVLESVDAWQQKELFNHLVCCAGVLHVGPLHELSMSTIKQTFDVNTFGVLALMQAIAKTMKTQGSGSMVIVGS